MEICQVGTAVRTVGSAMIVTGPKAATCVSVITYTAMNRLLVAVATV